MNNLFNKKLEDTYLKKNLNEKILQIDEVLFHEINPDNLSLVDLRKKIDSDIIELRISIGDLRNKISEGVDPYKLSDVYDNLSKQIYEKQQEIINIENVLAVQKIREPLLSDEEQGFINEFDSLIEGQDSELN